MPAPETPAEPTPNAGPVEQGLPERTPDLVEQDEPGNLDDVIPTRSYAQLPVVGLGGSAGGLTALQTFFGAMPRDTGMAFVVIMHLSPEHDSILAELLQRTTRMPVLQVHDRVKVEPDHVYVIPPAKHLSMDDGHVVLSDMPPRTGKHVAVDLFFRTLADTHGAHSAAIVLSGADGDGAIGLKRVKERGGLTIVQDPGEAEQDSMPRASIATGLVDWVLPVADMPARLCEYWRTEHRLQLPDEDGPQPALQDPRAAAAAGRPLPPDEAALHDILNLLRARTGHDFTYYKRATILRRIARRMQVNGVELLPGYLEFVRTHPGEPGALLQDLLISVTNFFRDREAFAALEHLIPSLFHGKGPGDCVRVWCAACATGEEAYSVAMLLSEYAETLESPPSIQVFATDLDENAVHTARDGLYTETIDADVSQERLRRFFSKTHSGYRVKREVREIVLFALHDLLKDAPFSRLDLVTCRNLFIYLHRDAQDRALEIFHFALRVDGKLFLGSSESVDEDSALFTVVDKKRRLYARRAAVRAGAPTYPGSSTLPRAMLERVSEKGVTHPHVTPSTLPPAKASAPSPAAGTPSPGSEPASWGQAHYEFIEQLAPPSVIVNQNHDILHVSEHAGRFMQVAGGEPTANLMRLVHPMLRIELRAALYQAAQTGLPVEIRDVPVELDGARRPVSLRVAPSRSASVNCLLVIFQEQDPVGIMPKDTGSVDAEREAAVRVLESELEQSKGLLRNTIEQADASAEELKASNEELQAINEELRSTTEELETGREELQSINEELNTVNQELKSKVEELGRSNSDLQNLMASTQIATVFLDRDLFIQRYTPPAIALFNLIPSDVGRPLSDLTPRLDYPDLARDAATVLERLTAVEMEVGHRDGRCFLARMMPYRTTEDYIAGVVLTFVDITRRHQAEVESRASEARFRAVADLVPDLLFSTDAVGRLLWCNQRWLDYTGQSMARAQGYGWADTIYADDRERVRRSFLESVRHGTPYRNEHRLISADGKTRWFLVRAEPLRDESGKITQWFGAKTDVEDLKHTSAELAASEERLRLVIENAREFAIFSTDLDLRITTWNPGAEHILGYAESEMLGHRAEIIFTPEDRAAGAHHLEATTALAEGRAADERWHQRRDGSRFCASGALMRMNDAGGQPVGFVKILRDETERRETRLTLEHSREKLEMALREAEAARAESEAAGKAKDHFLAVLSHELRTPLTPVMMAVHLLERNRDLPPAASEALEMIRRNVAIEAHFIDDLLDITRITRGKLEVVCEPMDLHAAVRAGVEITLPDIQEKAQRLAVELEAREHRLRGDNHRLQQVFWNLLKNASKFTPEGGAIRVTSRNVPGRLIVAIADTGIGFEEEAITRIFNAFEQANTAVTREYGGLGLGLAISKASVDAHGGTLRAESPGRGQGATFTVELPLS